MLKNLLITLSKTIDALGIYSNNNYSNINRQLGEEGGRLWVSHYEKY